MGYETENLKRELERLKYEFTRKVDKEEFIRYKHDLQEAERKLGYLEGRIYELENRLENQSILPGLDALTDFLGFKDPDRLKRAVSFLEQNKKPDSQ